MIEIRKTRIYRYDEWVGYQMGSVVCLVKNLSDADKRRIREATDCEHIVQIGEIAVTHNRSEGKGNGTPAV